MGSALLVVPAALRPLARTTASEPLTRDLQCKFEPLVVAPATDDSRDVDMKALIQDRYGSPEVLRLQDFATPKPSADEVLVRVQAAGVDRGVWHLVGGTPYIARLAPR